jgi:hypothetical protein
MKNHSTKPTLNNQSLKVLVSIYQDKIGTQKHIKTPPKTSATKSVHDNESQ